MDPTLLLGLVASAISIASLATQTWSKFKKDKSDTEVSQGANQNAKDQIVYDNIWKFVSELQQQVTEANSRANTAEAKAGAMEVKYETLQGMYKESLERIETLEQQIRKVQAIQIGNEEGN